MQSISVFLDIAKFSDFWRKMLMSAEFKGCVTWFMHLSNLLYVRYNCAQFYHCRICVADFRKGPLFAPLPICEQLGKNPSWIELLYFIRFLSLAVPHLQSVIPSTTSLGYISTYLQLQLIYNVCHKPESFGKFNETLFSPWEMGNNLLNEVDLHKCYISNFCTEEVK